MWERYYRTWLVPRLSPGRTDPGTILPPTCPVLPVTGTTGWGTGTTAYEQYYRFSNRYYRSAFSWYILDARGEAPLSASFIPTSSTHTRAAAGDLEAAGALS